MAQVKNRKFGNIYKRADFNIITTEESKRQAIDVLTATLFV